MKKKTFLILCFWIFTAPGVLFAREDVQLYRMAVKSAKAGQKDFAFLQYSSLLRGYPDSKYARQALFAQGEYFFYVPDYRQSREWFESFIEKYPESEAKLFALAFLFKIAQVKNNQELIEDLRRQIVNFKQVSLIFRDFEEYTYRSPLGQECKAFFHIDRIEFYIEGELFAKVPF